MMESIAAFLLVGSLVFVPTTVILGCAVAYARDKPRSAHKSASFGAGLLLCPVWAPVFGLDAVSIAAIPVVLVLAGLSYLMLMGVRGDG